MAAAVAAAILTLAAGCGNRLADRPAGPASTGSPAPSATAAGGPRTSLAIEVRASAGMPWRRWTLSCDPAGGSLPGAAAACAVLARVRDPFAPVRRGVMCPMIYGGPQQATVEGTYRGKPVHATFSRVDGCQITRWDRIAPVFGPGTPFSPRMP